MELEMGVNHWFEIADQITFHCQSDIPIVNEWGLRGGGETICGYIRKPT